MQRQSKRDMEINEILTSLATYWHKHPDQKFFQALTNICSFPYLCITRKPTGKDAFFLEDNEVIEAMKKEVGFINNTDTEI